MKQKIIIEADGVDLGLAISLVLQVVAKGRISEGRYGPQHCHFCSNERHTVSCFANPKSERFLVYPNSK